ncbi:sigma factor-like helix-turn-helix DNA-binding protein [Bacillus sp. FJAT-45350]|uniref:sigma factor-like helix-turn-helix DNA-binding protein n=1 Tax=Bacillus sp. FJAT-45350 TaxID=2011014 RepID=UPI000BB7B27B|nr:sigma factor-like helix-turn-helix DNA-binding protein [Bacillus sp. FJAT-45350]
MDDLIMSYKQSLKKIRTAYQNASEEDKTYLSSMASDLEYSLEWMKTGRRPGNTRGVERLAAYQREKALDPLLMQNFYRSVEQEEKEDVITDFDKMRIEDALSVLTTREKEMYVMSRGQMISYERIASMLVVSKSTVQTTVERAERKIAEQISCSLFSFVG